ncbi:hypothetical protein EV644_1133 [Kribbella orskensis]|uniref:Uncharacterized protein n=1 Tax=Kribbella orskensis TaxID=2512216 RepID=A0ABY2BEW0_9ACTN|nr:MULTISPECIES: hypothetical protein [Kribbella]TCN36535.1 hypothetical protein EV642_1143 [Kribbella sp. VKM Ac-2500]TCO17773.1 hypothetical protein EV644_1133 [Kribbella orskensis]
MPDGRTPAAQYGTESSVTLLTGDKVTLGAPDAKGDPAVRIKPRTPGTGAFSVRRDAGRVSVIPRTSSRWSRRCWTPRCST